MDFVLDDDSAGADDPSYRPLVYQRMLPLWQKCRTVFQGTSAIRAAGDEILPQFVGEDDDHYEVRKNLVAFYNAYARTVRASVGMLLQQEPALGKDMSSSQQALWENIDGAGTHGTVFTRSLATNGIIDGLGGIFVTKQRITNPRAVDSDTERRLGLRPFWIKVRADDVMRELYELRDGRLVLTCFIRRQVVKQKVGRFGSRALVQYYVYTRDERDVITSERWSCPIGTDRSPTLDAGSQTVMEGLTEIPWAPFVAGEQPEGLGTEIKPPLLDLADLNINHHQQNTNIQHLEDRAMVPTPVRIGAPKDKDGHYPELVMGPDAVIEAPHIEGVNQPVYWFSPPIDVLEPSVKTLAWLEDAMGREGGAFLAPDPAGVESVEAKRIKAAASRATLSTVSRALQDCLESAYVHTAAFLREKAGSIALNRDFEQMVMEPNAMVAYVQAVAQAKLPPRVLLEAWQRGGRIPDSVDLDALEQEMLTDQIAAERRLAQAQADQNALGRGGNVSPDLMPAGAGGA
jgi:hypothetical protein